MRLERPLSLAGLLGVNTEQDSGAEPSEAVDALARDYPGWHIWRGRNGSGQPTGWYATRQRRLSARERDAGLFPTLAAENPRHLRQQLARQSEAQWRGDAVG